MQIKRIGEMVAAAACLTVAGAPGTGSAQFHTQTEGGQTVPSANGTATTAGANAPAVYRGDYQNAGMIDTGAVEGAKLGFMDLHDSQSLGQTTYHPDGSYTEFKRLDFDTPTLAQFTKSPTGVLLWKRIISFDNAKKPVEVMIYDHSDNLRFRGILNYDRAGNFQQEMIFDRAGQVVRTKTQEYDAGGRPTKLKVVDDLKVVPKDFQLVISPGASGKDSRVDERGILRGGTAATEPANQPEPANSSASPEEPRRKGWLGKIFGKD